MVVARPAFSNPSKRKITPTARTERAGPGIRSGLDQILRLKINVVMAIEVHMIKENPLWPSQPSHTPISIDRCQQSINHSCCAQRIDGVIF
jgi:hypothetical protein